MMSVVSKWRTIEKAVATVLAPSPRRMAAAFFFSVLFAAAFLLVPVFAIPGNTLEFWLAIAPWWMYPLLAFYAAGMGVLAVMAAYVFESGASATAAGGLIPGMVSGLYSTAACGACIAGVFSFLGSGASLFLMENRTPLMLAGLGLTGASLYFFSKKVNHACDSCKIKEAKIK